MQIQFQLEEADILALQEDVVDSSYAHDVKRKYFKWIITFILLLATIWIWRSVAIVGIILLVVTAGFFLFASSIYISSAKNVLKKKILKQDHSRLLQPCTMEFAGEGINRILGEESTYFSWDKFTRYSTDDGHYFLYVDDLQGLIVPKKPNKVENAVSGNFQQELEDYLKTIDNN